MVVLAQLVRASDCGSEGRGFEPHTPPKTPDKQLFVRSFLCSNRKYQKFKLINPPKFGGFTILSLMYDRIITFVSKSVLAYNFFKSFREFWIRSIFSFLIYYDISLSTCCVGFGQLIFRNLYISPRDACSFSKNDL